MQDPWVVGKKFWSFPSNFFTQSFQYFQIVNLVDCLSSWNKFFMNSPSYINFANFVRLRVCMYVRMYIYIYIYIYTHTHTHTHTYIHTYTRTHTPTPTHTLLFIYWVMITGLAVTKFGSQILGTLMHIRHSYRRKVYCNSYTTGCVEVGWMNAACTSPGKSGLRPSCSYISYFWWVDFDICSKALHPLLSTADWKTLGNEGTAQQF